MADLEKLEDEERAISRRRTELLAEIDRLHPGAPLSDTDAARLRAIQEESGDCRPGAGRCSIRSTGCASVCACRRDRGQTDAWETLGFAPLVETGSEE